MSTTRGFAAKHPTLVYFAMTFAISWGGALMAIDASGAPPRRFFPASSFRMRTSPFCWSASRWDYRPASSRNWLDGLRHPDAETPFQHPGNRIDRRRLVECVAPVTERLVEPRGIGELTMPMFLTATAVGVFVGYLTAVIAVANRKETSRQPLRSSAFLRYLSISPQCDQRSTTESGLPRWRQDQAATPVTPIGTAQRRRRGVRAPRDPTRSRAATNQLRPRRIQEQASATAHRATAPPRARHRASLRGRSYGTALPPSLRASKVQRSQQRALRRVR